MTELAKPLDHTQTLSAMIPFHNNRKTLEHTVESILDQGIAKENCFAVDDASTDDSLSLMKAKGVKVVCTAKNLGRGAVRALGIDNCSTQLLLSCDATNALDQDFVRTAIPWFTDTQVAAVYGRLVDRCHTDTASRWRARHLFQQQERKEVNEHSSLCTWAYIARKDAFLAVGNFEVQKTHSEDVDIGERLLKAGYKVVFEPSCIAYTLTQNTALQCLERHWRWYVARQGRMTFQQFRRWTGLAWRTMVAKDIRARDARAALITLLLPFHHWWKSYHHAPKH